MKMIALKILATLLCGMGGAASAWLLGYAIYFFTEDLPFRNEPPEVRLVHAVDGGLAIGILTFLIMMPFGALVGAMTGYAYLSRGQQRSVEITKIELVKNEVAEK